MLQRCTFWLVIVELLWHAVQQCSCLSCKFTCKTCDIFYHQRESNSQVPYSPWPGCLLPYWKLQRASYCFLKLFSIHIDYSQSQMQNTGVYLGEYGWCTCTFLFKDFYSFFPGSIITVDGKNLTLACIENLIRCPRI